MPVQTSGPARRGAVQVLRRLPRFAPPWISSSLIDEPFVYLVNSLLKQFVVAAFVSRPNPTTQSAAAKTTIMTTPRVFIIRHGETEWSLNGRHTGTTELPLTTNGESRVRATGQALVGDDRLIVPRNLAHIYVSPRHRAQRTFELLGVAPRCALPWTRHGAPHEPHCSADANIEITNDIREWDYGDYEGLTSKTIREDRKKAGDEGDWDIWRDGCPGGESPEQITERLDRLIADIRTRFHEPALSKPKTAPSGTVAKGAAPSDVLVVAHGHILRAFAARWINKNIAENPSLILEAGGVGTLSYEHHSVHEPAILLGGAFMVDIVEHTAEDAQKS
ncbi:MAG: hypothetical protein M1821_003161 [Bathelium mastoideum]|nr:MAG: hypothetical protein M1821_003161 [Bathelium mastoideum]